MQKCHFHTNVRFSRNVSKSITTDKGHMTECSWAKLLSANFGSQTELTAKFRESLHYCSHESQNTVTLVVLDIWHVRLWPPAQFYAQCTACAPAPKHQCTSEHAKEMTSTFGEVRVNRTTVSWGRWNFNRRRGVAPSPLHNCDYFLLIFSRWFTKTFYVMAMRYSVNSHTLFNGRSLDFCKCAEKLL